MPLPAGSRRNPKLVGERGSNAAAGAAVAARVLRAVTPHDPHPSRPAVQSASRTSGGLDAVLRSLERMRPRLPPPPVPHAPVVERQKRGVRHHTTIRQSVVESTRPCRPESPDENHGRGRHTVVAPPARPIRLTTARPDLVWTSDLQRCRAGVGVAVEAPPGLPTQEAALHHARQEGRGRIRRIFELLVQGFGDRFRGVEADEVGQRQWALRMRRPPTSDRSTVAFWLARRTGR